MVDEFTDRGLELVMSKRVEANNKYCEAKGTPSVLHCPAFKADDPTPRDSFIQLHMRKARK